MNRTCAGGAGARLMVPERGGGGGALDAGAAGGAGGAVARAGGGGGPPCGLPVMGAVAGGADRLATMSLRGGGGGGAAAADFRAVAGLLEPTTTRMRPKKCLFSSKHT